MFKLSQRSLDRLQGVHPDLVSLVKKAIELTEVDFTVTEGLRSKEEQQRLVAERKSWTFNSRHLTGHAVDLGAWVNGSLSYDWEYYFQIADAMRRASIELGIPVQWGGLWRKNLAEEEGSLKGLQQIFVRDFQQAQGRSPHLDGPHFELPRIQYPS